LEDNILAYIVRMMKSRRVRWARHVARMRIRRGRIIIIGLWWENREEKTLLRRPRRRWEDNIQMDHREIGIGGVDWIHLGLMEGSCEHGSIRCWNILGG
jgi:hypothetical protein